MILKIMSLSIKNDEKKNVFSINKITPGVIPTVILFIFALNKIL